MNELVTRYMGNCQICEKDFKLLDGRTVHHGFTRPGDGYIHGDCFGVHAEPYEVSTACLQLYLEGLRRGLTSAENRLIALTTGAVDELYVERTDKENPRIFGKPRPTKTVKLLRAETESMEWDEEIARARKRVQQELGMLDFEIARAERRIAAWSPKPIREFDELKRNPEEQEKKVARAAEREQKRAAKAVKEAATRAKQAALATKRQAIRDDFKAKFEALANSPENLNERRAVALKLAMELRKKKYDWMYNRLGELKCDDALIMLGLAKHVPWARGETRLEYWRY